ncbi:alanine-glyoxylate transaminase/serine-glyoxylate transaminase/serine-pyruvate transaminase [Rhodovulum bhavnagarense]|uniref:Alanine-glyoxylate transaminase/serine-glyoxylate transaminase/serine-pyruvate transaminase n=1 Tax=Rhodovulum bhavnagarense TaxID=992286 RepID=A0A4R2RGI5_9RHOB|nr:L-aspartate--glyoxylate aminotransferase BhcA [Rhodovulum bhavnagarense]TCP62780.1 alanine-glyoxylate transaminase/serine-glyoxylate transaminase/serine-pyruvate transaminase [Rhodovulum bhavnagarense]
MSDQNPVFIPGPTNIPEVIRKACDIPTMDHRSAAFAPLYDRARSGVAKVLNLGEGGEVVLFPATGTGGWEAAVTNTLSPGDRVLAARHGMFSQKWIDLCQRHGLDVQVIEAPWGAGVPVEAFAQALAADTGHAIKAVLVTHNETATGVTSDVGAVRAALDAAGHPALLMVDGVSSIASIPFRMSEWGVDVAVAGSQKGFMLPPGLAIVGLSAKALATIQNAGLARCFFDIRDMLSGIYPYTPPVALINGLAASTDLLLGEGMPAVAARHHRIAEGVRRAVAAWGLAPCAQSPDLYSDTVTAIVVPEGVDGNALVAHAARAYGVAFGAGLGAVAGKVFRIGHLGMMTDVMALAGLATAEMAMADIGIEIVPGSGVAAAQGWYRESRAG